MSRDPSRSWCRRSNTGFQAAEPVALSTNRICFYDNHRSVNRACVGRWNFPMSFLPNEGRKKSTDCLENKLGRNFRKLHISVKVIELYHRHLVWKRHVFPHSARVRCLPQGRQSNLRWHFRVNSTTKCKSRHGIGADQLRIREETLESGNPFSGSWISASIPYINSQINETFGICQTAPNFIHQYLLKYFCYNCY